jgi:hypothetical protein
LFDPQVFSAGLIEHPASGLQLQLIPSHDWIGMAFFDCGRRNLRPASNPTPPMNSLGEHAVAKLLEGYNCAQTVGAILEDLL